MRHVMQVRWWLLFALLLCLPFAQARSDSTSQDGIAIQTIAVADLPKEARETLHLILHGGPYPYPRDGVVFGNYEQRLPQQPRGYYHEYTVSTPGVRHRGARRIVCGVVPECYYTADHYRTFRRIEE